MLGNQISNHKYHLESGEEIKNKWAFFPFYLCIL